MRKIEKTILGKIKDFDKALMRSFLGIKLNEELNFEDMPSPSQMRVMQYIIENDYKDIYQRDLENVLGIKRASVSGILHTMEKHDFIERVIDETDTRTKKIIVKDKIKEKYEEAKKQVEELEKDVIKGISNEDLETFLRVLEMMKKNIE